MGIVSASGGGKTVFVLNLINQMQDTFGKIYVVYKASEPLYEFLAKSIGDKNITFLHTYPSFHPLQI
jgi:ABC-type dipeptide/oligopeptide/nickel transport system ATPase subunit